MVNKLKSGIYKIFNIKNDEIYIGSAVNLKNRWNKHKWALKNKKHHSIILQRAFDKYGIDFFKFEIIEYVEVNSLIGREQYWIDKYSPTYNVLQKAGSSKGFKHSEETKRKLREMNLGSKNPMFGFKYPKKNNKYPKKNKENNIIKTYDWIKKEVIRISKEGDTKEYNSITEAALDLGTKSLGGVQHVLSGRRKHYKGYFFKYKNPEDCP
jgi:group I intron endonuclease